VVHRPDWRVVPPRSITGYDLAGPRVAVPRTDRREDARQTVSGLSTNWVSRRNVRAAEELSNGRIVATLDGVQLESWLPSGRRQWAVRDDDRGGRDIAIAADERSAWVGLMRPPWEECAQAVVRLALQDGAQSTTSLPPSRCPWCDVLTACPPSHLLVGTGSGAGCVSGVAAGSTFGKPFPRRTGRSLDQVKPGLRQRTWGPYRLANVRLSQGERRSNICVPTPGSQVRHTSLAPAWRPPTGRLLRVGRSTGPRAAGASRAHLRAVP
jgi:hypothetical protein